MNSDLPELRGEFLDDFYAESDELLNGIRAQLSRLEASGGGGGPDPTALEALYRHTHSLKGVSAMVGLRAAEQLAHAAEGLIRLFSRGERPLANEHLDILSAATHRLEQVIAAHRLEQPLPTVSDLVARLNSYDLTAGPGSPVPPLAPDEIPPEQAAPAAPEHTGAVWHVSFAPSAELDKRGININTVRARLSALGQITSASPLIQGAGRMSFEFTVAMAEPPPDPAALELDGIFLRPNQPAGAPSAMIAGAHAPDQAPSSLFVSPSHIVRVELSRLDELMRIVGEMVIHRSRLEERIARSGVDRSAFQDVNLALGRSLRELREAITRVRLVPVAEIFNRLPFVVRDLARETGKQVRIAVEGHDTEIDKYVVERLKEPLLHLVRNAVSHGLETPGERLQADKPEEATITLTAAAAGQFVVIQIHDDGRGLDTKKIVSRAANHGIRLPDSPTDADLLAVIARPGFTTRDATDRASGRGVGMAVVHRTIRELSGNLSVESSAGRGTRFTMRLPLTLSIADTFLVTVDKHTCAVPQVFVEEILQFAESDVRTIQDAEIIPYRDGVLPLVRLRRMFDAPPLIAKQPPLLVLATERGLCGLVVDRVLGEREVVVRAMHDPLIRVPGVSGATELGDGKPVLILDPLSISSGAIRPRAQALSPVRPRSQAAST